MFLEVCLNSSIDVFGIATPTLALLIHLLLFLPHARAGSCVQVLSLPLLMPVAVHAVAAQTRCRPLQVQDSFATVAICDQCSFRDRAF